MILKTDYFSQDFDDKSLSNSKEKKLKFDLEDFIFKNRHFITFFLAGLTLIGLGIVFFKTRQLEDSPKIEVFQAESKEDSGQDLVVEIAGSVQKPGVYKLPSGSRVEDLLIEAGGLSADADREWVSRFLNRASRLVDGQKIFIPKSGTTLGPKNTNTGTSYTLNKKLVNINTASQKELEDLPGIGPVYAQNIIEHRPYSSVEELLSKGVLKKNVYEKVKDSLTVW